MKSTKSNRIAGWILTGLAVLFLLLDSVLKLIEHEQAIKGTEQLGYKPEAVFTLGIILLICTIFYVISRTSFIGAILLTGYLGGAVATQFRLDQPLFSHTLFPIYIAVFVWAGLLLRNDKLRSLFLNSDQ